MKFTLRSLLMVTLLLLSGSSLAGKWIIGASVAAIRGDNDDKLLNSQLASRGLDATAKTEDDIRLTLQPYGGYDFSKRWGVELSYLDLDKVETTFTGTTTDIENFLNSAQDIHPQTAQGWLVSAVHYFPFDYNTRIKARIGLYDWTADYTLQGGNATKLVSEKGTDISYGVGLELGSCYKDGKYGHLRWDYYNVDEKTFNVIAVGLSYCIGAKN